MKESILYGNAPHPLTADGGSALLLDLRTDGHFYRTGHLLNAAATKCAARGGTFRTVLLTADKTVESDEYDLLQRLADLLSESDTLLTFHGTSSLLPFLSKKYKLYGLPDPLAGKSHIDLAEVLSPLYYLLRLPSRKAEDYLRFLTDTQTGSPYDPAVPSEDFAAALPRLTHLLPYVKLLSEPFSCVMAGFEKTDVYFSLVLPQAVPRPFSFRAGPFCLSVRDGTGKLCAEITDGNVKYFYGNYKDFYYLTEEGYAVDKRIGALVPKERRLPCTRKTAYTLAAAGPDLLSDTPLRRQYLESVRAFLRSEIGMERG